MTKIINEVRNDELTPQQANAIICGCNAVLGSIRLDNQERKIAELEKPLGELEENRR